MEVNEQLHAQAAYHSSESPTYPHARTSVAQKSPKFKRVIVSVGAGVAQSVQRLATGWTTEGSEFESR
jgi:hypothetical protein